MSDVEEPALEGSEAPEEEKKELREENVRAIRLGHGANCSSVGSVIDTLFLGAAVGGAIFAAVCAAMKNERVTVVGTGAATSPARAGARSTPDDEDRES